MNLSKKQKKLFCIFFSILETHFKFLIFEKRDDSHSLCISESTDCNILNRPKHSWYLHNSTFIIFIDNFEENWVGKSLS